jgi:hypothetical protein
MISFEATMAHALTYILERVFEFHTTMHAAKILALFDCILNLSSYSGCHFPASGAYIFIITLSAYGTHPPLVPPPIFEGKTKAPDVSSGAWHKFA